jgi:hypothetical protein
MLTGGEFRDDATIVGMQGHLRRNDVRERSGARPNDGSRSLVARAFDTQNQSLAADGSVIAVATFVHLSIIGE